MRRHQHLRNRADFRRLRLQGKTWHHPALKMSVAPNHLPHNRFGFIVSKRLGKAVVRNRLRRRLRACIGTLNTEIQPGYDVAFIVQEPCVTMPYQDLCEVVITLMKKAKLWKGAS